MKQPTEYTILLDHSMPGLYAFVHGEDGNSKATRLDSAKLTPESFSSRERRIVIALLEEAIDNLKAREKVNVAPKLPSGGTTYASGTASTTGSGVSVNISPGASF